MKLKEIAENHGLTPEGVNYALTQYQIVICEITHGMLSKLSYDAKYIIHTAQERWCDTCDLKELLAAYDTSHKGPPGAARKLIEDAPTVGGWISVKDRLPEIGEKVLVYSKFGHVSDMTLQRHGGQNGYDVLIFDPHGMKPGTDITHWMPLPEQPEVSE